MTVNRLMECPIPRTINLHLRVNRNVRIRGNRKARHNSQHREINPAINPLVNNSNNSNNKLNNRLGNPVSSLSKVNKADRGNRLVA